MKQVLIPALLFIVSAFLSLSVIHLAFASFILGAAFTVVAMVRVKRVALSEATDGGSILLRSGVVLMVAPVLTVALVVAGMSGFFR